VEISVCSAVYAVYCDEERKDWLFSVVSFSKYQFKDIMTVVGVFINLFLSIDSTMITCKFNYETNKELL